MLYNINHAPISSGLCIIADKHGIWISITHYIHLPCHNPQNFKASSQVISRTVPPFRYALSAPVNSSPNDDTSKRWQNVYVLEIWTDVFCIFSLQPNFAPRPIQIPHLCTTGKKQEITERNTNMWDNRPELILK
jgi:hypothetical protein